MSGAPGVPPWRPDRLARRLPLLRRRARLEAGLRAWFAVHEFDEVRTPALQVSPGLEPHLGVFATRLQGPERGEGVPRYLHTSPEFAMKKLLAGGMRRIFQLAPCFRNAESGPTHHPEFLMLEWYRAEAGYEQLMEDCEALIHHAAATLEVDRLTWRGRSCDPFERFERLTVAEAFSDYAGIDLLGSAPDPLRPERDLLALQAVGQGIRVTPSDTWEDLVFRILGERIEPRLGFRRLTILTDYPLAMAALARPRPDDLRVAERFELYACGVELANGFGELTDPVEQRRRFTLDQEVRRRLYGETVPIDEEFLAALAHGLPPCAGIALGVDRLAMLLLGAETIEDVLWLPVA